MAKRGADFIICLYQNSRLIPHLIESILGAADDFRLLGGRILFINNSPEDERQAHALEVHLPHIQDVCDVSVLVNEQNLGFVRSCNRGLERACLDGHDAFLINSGAFHDRFREPALE